MARANINRSEFMQNIRAFPVVEPNIVHSISIHVSRIIIVLVSLRDGKKYEDLKEEEKQLLEDASSFATIIFKVSTYSPSNNHSNAEIIVREIIGDNDESRQYISSESNAQRVFNLVKKIEGGKRIYTGTFDSAIVFLESIAEGFAKYARLAMIAPVIDIEEKIKQETAN